MIEEGKNAKVKSMEKPNHVDAFFSSDASIEASFCCSAAERCSANSETVACMIFGFSKHLSSFRGGLHTC